MEQRKIIDKLNNKYNSKAKDSFKTKLNLFLFTMAINNKDIIDKEEFINFVVESNDEWKLYIEVYWQAYELDSKTIFDSENTKYNISINEVYNNIKSIRQKNSETINELKRDFQKNRFIKTFNEIDFNELLKGEKCYYCDITEAEIKKLILNRKIFKKHPTRGWTLEIDRKKPNLGYTKENSVLCCYWCNNAKTDEFDDEEFKAVGKAIKKIWKNRLSKLSNSHN